MKVDARGMSCPKPVMMAKKAVETSAGADVVVMVDENSAAENVARFARTAGMAAEIVKAEGGHLEVRLSLREGSGSDKALDFDKSSFAPFCASDVEDGGAVTKGRALLITSDRIGIDEELGGLLMRAMLNALADNEILPEKIIIMNAGVKMTLAGIDTADALKALEDRNVDVMVCGTCLKHYGLMESERAGRVSNAYEILNALLESNVSPLI